MKKIKCLDCDKEFEFTSETPEEAMQKMHPHYLEEHKDIMANGTEEDKKVWMEKFRTNWEAAPEA